MTREDVARELCARLHARLDGLRQSGRVYQTTHAKIPVGPKTTETVQCVWGLGEVAEDNRRLRDHVEALALLNALARLDSQQFIEQMKAFWPLPSLLEAIQAASAPRQAVGYAFSVSSREEYAEIREHVMGRLRLPRTFLREVEWLETTLRAMDNVDAVRWTPIPLRIVLSFDEDLKCLLEEIVRDVVTQHEFYTSAAPTDCDPTVQATLMMRFHIVEVLLDRESTTVTINVDALQCLSQLAELGIRIGRLPTIQDEDMSSKDHLLVTESLRALLPAWRDDSMLSSCVDKVFVSNETSRRITPALFSALQTVEVCDLPS